MHTVKRKYYGFLGVHHSNRSIQSSYRCCLNLNLIFPIIHYIYAEFRVPLKMNIIVSYIKVAMSEYILKEKERHMCTTMIINVRHYRNLTEPSDVCHSTKKTSFLSRANAWYEQTKTHIEDLTGKGGKQLRDLVLPLVSHAKNFLLSDYLTLRLINIEVLPLYILTEPVQCKLPTCSNIYSFTYHTFTYIMLTSYRQLIGSVNIWAD